MKRFSIIFMTLLFLFYLEANSQNKISEKKVLKILNSSSLKGNLFKIVSNKTIDGYFRKDFKNIYCSDFNKNGYDDLLIAANVNMGCVYQFLIYDYKINNIVIQIPKINNECPFYSVVIPSDSIDEFECYYFKRDNKANFDTILETKLILFENSLVEKLSVNDIFPIDAFNIIINDKIKYIYQNEKLKIITGINEEVLSDDLTEKTLKTIQKINFSNLKKNEVHFDDAPSIKIKIKYKDGNQIEFEDKVNPFTLNSQYNNLYLSDLYEIIF